MTNPEAARHATVLVVDDVPDSLRFLTKTIEQAGMTVLFANSGEDALELLQEVQPDLILMDALMPGKDGFEVTQVIKTDPALSHIPVIFMTGLTDTEHVVRGLAAGGVDYVRKPIVVDELLARLSVHLTNARVARGSHSALDAMGRHLVAVDRELRMLWSTPQADALLLATGHGWTRGDRAPPELNKVIGQLSGSDIRIGACARLDTPEPLIEFVLVERRDPVGLVLRLIDVRDGVASARLQSQYGLSPREAEVLIWLSYGKSNRTISEILQISPHTVSRHAEQVFEKLGVETRAAAAVIAAKVISA